MFDDLNNKSFSVLPTKQELGLEMAIAPAIGAALIGGAFSIGSSLLGAKSASDNRNAQEKAQKKQAEAANKYNKKKFKNDKENFLAQREYNYETALRNYEYNTQIQAMNYENQVRAFEKDKQNLSNQLEFNNVAERAAYLREQNVMRDINIEQTYQRQGVYIESMKAKAAAAAGPTGAGTDRAMMMALAEKGRQLAVLDASYTGALRESNLNLMDIARSKMGADMRAQAATMLAPSKPIDLIKPTQAPLPKFTEPEDVFPGVVPGSNSVGTVLAGIANAAAPFAGLDYTNPNQFTTPPSAYSFQPIGGYGGTMSPSSFSSGLPWGSFGSSSGNTSLTIRNNTFNPANF